MNTYKTLRLIGIFCLISVSIMLLGLGGKTVPGPNRPPVARAGMDQVVERFETVALNASESFDPDGDKLTYTWDLVARPSNGTAKLTGDRGMATCRFVPDAVGAWLIRLTVSDGRHFSDGDVVQIRVQEPPSQPSLPLPPQTTVPDLEVIDFVLSGITQGKYVKELKAHIRTRSGVYGGPLDFRIIGLDKLMGGKFVFDKTVTIHNVGLVVGDEKKWFTLLRNEIPWPEDVCQATFAVTIDPGNKVAETNKQNNTKDKTIYRDELVGDCDVRIFPELIKMGKNNFRPAPDRTQFIFASENAKIFIPFRNCCPADHTSKLAIIYDWNPLRDKGENKKLLESTQTFKSGENKSLTFSVKIPKKKEFKTLAILREHDKGYDVLYSVDVRVD